MSNKLSPLFNSTSALLEFQIWSDATSHAIPFKSCATTGKNQFELVTASLNDVLPMRNGSTPLPLLKSPYFPAWWFISEKHVVEDDVLFTNSNPLHTSPFWLNIVLDVPKLNNYTNTHTTQLYFTDNFLCSFYLFSQSQQSLTKCNFFCFESPKLSLSFFNCSCSPIDVKMEQKGQS